MEVIIRMPSAAGSLYRTPFCTIKTSLYSCIGYQIKLRTEFYARLLALKQTILLLTKLFTALKRFAPNT